MENQFGESNWNEKYSMIGKYVVSFEETVNQLRFTLQLMLQQQGLKTWKIGEIIFEQKQFTAEPLISCFESIANEILKQEDSSKEILKKISEFRKKFSNAIVTRNDLLHGTYHFGENSKFIGEISEDYFHVTKGSPNKEGARKKQVASTNNDIKKFLDELDQIRSDFWDLRYKLLICLDKLEEDKK